MDTLILILTIILLGLIAADVVVHFFVKKDPILSTIAVPVWKFVKVVLFGLTYFAWTIILVSKAFSII